MKVHKILISLLTIVMIGSLFAGTVSALDATAAQANPTAFENVRDYAPATTLDGQSYIVDGGKLFAGANQHWSEVDLPRNVIAGVVAVGTQNGSEVLYVGAANETILYRSLNQGQNWERYILSNEAIGGITAIAVDRFQQIVYVGTDTDGAYRLRDVGSSMTINGHLQLNTPVLEIAADSNGAGLAFIRTNRNLYRAENMGLSWVEVGNLSSFPTAVVVTNQTNDLTLATVYVGTSDRGLLRSIDGGHTWQLANQGLNMTPGSRLYINALFADPIQPNVLYVSTSYLFGSTTVTQTPALVAVTENSASSWSNLGTDVANGALVDDLMPVSGETGTVYALSTQSRAPFSLGDAPALVVAPEPVETASWLAFVQENLAWSISALSAFILMIVAGIDFFNGRGGSAQKPTTRPTISGTFGSLFARSSQ